MLSGKGSQRLSTGVPSASSTGSAAGVPADSLSDRSIEESPKGQLMALLSSPVIRRSPALTDRYYYNVFACFIFDFIIFMAPWWSLCRHSLATKVF